LKATNLALYVFFAKTNNQPNLNKRFPGCKSGTGLTGINNRLFITAFQKLPMKISIISNEILKQELINTSQGNEPEMAWTEKIETIEPGEVCIDLLFENTAERIQILKNTNAKLVIVNGVDLTLENLPVNFLRINAWPTFLKNKIIETSLHQNQIDLATEIFSGFGKKIKEVPDIKGFVTPRIISMIINEAYFALEENVSTKNEIDLAMKLGTNYPYGPFEWAEKIGFAKIYSLLTSLSRENTRYTPARLLKKELI
jgi:3-hydroxybutyryl-CoA dehydrogenase